MVTPPRECRWTGMTSYRIGPHRTWTEHLDLEIARFVGRIGSGVQVRTIFFKFPPRGSVRSQGDCVFLLSKRGHFWSVNESLYIGPMRSFRGPGAEFRSDVANAVRCGPLRSDVLCCPPMRSDAVISHTLDERRWRRRATSWGRRTLFVFTHS